MSKEVTPLSVSLDGRLAAAADYVKRGGVVADIGTDHAFLPISLLLSGKCKAAVVSDINRGPLDCAKSNADKYGVTEKMEFFLADGLKDLPLDEYGVTDIVICGMGGELITSIIAASEYPKKTGVRLVLQPMTHSADLRRYLASEGYCTVDETLVESGNKIYECIAAEYDGTARSITPAEAELGAHNIDRAFNNELFVGFFLSSYILLCRRIDGMKKGGLSTEKEEELVCEYRNIAERFGIDI